MITTGVVGQRWRGSVTPWGALETWDGSRDVDWYVAADDRWHVPRNEAAVRQSRIDGTPAAETRVRVPGGDVVQTIYSCADAGGVTVIEVANESPMPVAVAFDRRDLLTERPIVDMPIEGIDLPDGSFVMPIGHRARIRVALPHAGAGGGPLPAVPSAAQVVRGWLALSDRASRFVLPEGESGSALASRVVAERCELALGRLVDAADDPASFTLGAGELVRLGEAPAKSFVDDVAEAVEAIATDTRWEAGVALAAGARVLAAAGEGRAVGDVERIMERRAGQTPTTSTPDDLFVVPWLESRFADGRALFPRGIPSAWLGQSIEAHGIPTGPASSVSLAVRWHGARPAVLWEQAGVPVELTSPGWSTRERAGDALWPSPG